jgi:dethiobiotin synthetase
METAAARDQGWRSDHQDFIQIEMNYFVTGTDTGVGKTLISCALLHAFAAQGKRVAGMKPVAAGGSLRCNGALTGVPLAGVAGCDAEEQNEDVLKLRAAGNVAAGYGQINPYFFLPAIAPHIAAQRAGVIIQFSRIAQSYHELAAQTDVVIVEGAGGLLVPLNAQQDSADLVQELGLPIILVVGMRLGCLNHARLTVEAIAARGLTLAGWVANVADAGMVLVEENIAALQQRIAAPLLGVVPYLPQADARVAAGQLRLELLEP